MPQLPFNGPIVLVFDVNETLLDIEALNPLFGNERCMREWFAQLVLYSQATSLAGFYAQFGQLGAGILQMIGQTHGVAISGSDIEELRSRLLEMPAHPEVAHTLQQLREAGFRMVTLTNSAPDPQANPLERAGLAKYFERMFSVDDVKCFQTSSRHIPKSSGNASG